MAETARKRALVVEDEPAIRELVRFHLDLAGFAVDEVDDGRRALDRSRDATFDLILLDVMLPGLDGISVCRAIRAEPANGTTPILMITARDGESDTVLGLESGADDYLTKPFGVRELMARITAITRRHGARPRRHGAGGGRRPRRRPGARPAAPAPRGPWRGGGAHQAGVRPAAAARLATRHRLHPRGTAAAGVARGHLRHRADRRCGDQPPAAQDRGAIPATRSCC